VLLSFLPHRGSSGSELDPADDAGADLCFLWFSGGTSASDATEATAQPQARFLVWGSFMQLVHWRSLSGSISAIPYLWIYLGALVALMVDAISVFHREQKSIANELITLPPFVFCSLAYAATIGTISAGVIGLWAINTLFFQYHFHSQVA